MKRFLLILAILISVSAAVFPGDFILDPPPGTYAGTENVVITGPEGTVRYWFEESLDKSPVSYLYPLELSAYSGEERVYTIAIEGDTGGPYVYRIDRKPPSAPAASVESGVYGQDLYVTLNYDRGDSIFYSLSSDETLGYRPWRGEPIHMESPESGTAERVLKAYTVDSAGNRSGIAEYRYFLEAERGNGETSLLIRSQIGRAHV